MNDAQIKDRQRLPDKAKGAAPSTPDDRDATIGRLGRAIAEERQHAEMLRKTVEDLRFKAGILETSYAKQLEDARLRSETAESKLAELQARVAELETAHEDALRSLAEARAELERAPGSRGQLRKALASRDDRPINTNAQNDAESQTQEGTINRLMRASSRTDEREPVAREKQDLDTQARGDQDSPPEDMLAPDLVFALKGDDES